MRLKLVVRTVYIMNIDIEKTKFRTITTQSEGEEVMKSDPRILRDYNWYLKLLLQFLEKKMSNNSRFNFN